MSWAEFTAKMLVLLVMLFLGWRILEWLRDRK